MNIVNAVKIDKIVEEKLETEDEVSVIVVLKDDYSSLDKSIKSISKKGNLIKKKLMIEKQQNKVLENLNSDNETKEIEDFMKQKALVFLYLQ